MSHLHQIFCALPIAWSSSGGVAIRYVLLVLWMTSYLHIRRGMSVQLQRVTSLRCRAQANAPAASYWFSWLRRVIDDGGHWDWPRLRARDAGGGACNAPLHCRQYGLGCRVAQLVECLVTSGYPDGSSSGGPGSNPGENENFWKIPRITWDATTLA